MSKCVQPWRAKKRQVRISGEKIRGINGLLLGEGGVGEGGGSIQRILGEGEGGKGVGHGVGCVRAFCSCRNDCRRKTTCWVVEGAGPSAAGLRPVFLKIEKENWNKEQ